MSIYDFVWLMTDDSVEIAIYDMTTEEEIFCGTAHDASFESGYGDYEVVSFDLCPPDDGGVTLIINIETEEEE